MPAFQDITGRTFGRLTVMSRAETRCGQTMWACRCSCGSTTVVAAQNLKTNRTKSCGCLHRELLSKVSRDRLEGQPFGLLTVEAYSHTNSRGGAVWLCSCSCGGSATVPGASLKSGNTKSCGCLRHRP